MGAACSRGRAADVQHERGMPDYRPLILPSPLEQTVAAFAETPRGNAL